MIDRVEQDPSFWEKLFPFDLRRELVKKVVENVSELDCVERIVSMEVGEGANSQQRIFVLISACDCGDCNGYIPGQDGMHAVSEAILNSCPDQLSYEEVLGEVPLTTEAVFLGDREAILQNRFRKVTELYRRSSLSLEEFASLNFELN